MKKDKKTILKPCKYCGKEFRQYKSTDKFCSAQCFYKDHKPTQKKINPIPRTSEKKRKEDYEYKKKRTVFMSLSANKYCPVCKLAFLGEIDIKELVMNWIIIHNLGNVLTTECHHKAGRVGKLYLDDTRWLAVSNIGHKWIHAHPAKAYNLGFLIHSSSSK